MGLIRDMTVEDLNEVVALEDKVQRYKWPREAFEQALRLNQCCTVVDKDSKIVGYSVADLERGHGRTVAVTDPQIAFLFYQYWFERSRELGVRDLYAEVEADNEPAKQMLEHYGFTLAGLRPNFWGVGTVAEVYCKELV
jgi:ribosomal protein S18 acetylase RimI-like enzyme